MAYSARLLEADWFRSEYWMAYAKYSIISSRCSPLKWASVGGSDSKMRVWSVWRSNYCVCFAPMRILRASINPPLPGRCDKWVLKRHRMYGREKWCIVWLVWCMPKFPLPVVLYSHIKGRKFRMIRGSCNGISTWILCWIGSHNFWYQQTISWFKKMQPKLFSNLYISRHIK